MKQEPAVGWNISPTYGPVYLLQELHSHSLKTKGDMGNDGHYFVTKDKITVAYTRCWDWQKGFKGDPCANERRATTMLQGLPQAVADALDARRVYGPDQEGALPGGELISDDVQASITNNSFEEIMEAVKQEKHYGGISAEDVMRCIPRGMILHPTMPGWLSCRHCRRGNKLLELPNDQPFRARRSSQSGSDAPLPQALQRPPLRMLGPSYPGLQHCRRRVLDLACPRSHLATHRPRSLGLPLLTPRSLGLSHPQQHPPRHHQPQPLPNPRPRSLNFTSHLTWPRPALPPLRLHPQAPSKSEEIR